jgi:4-amino-4-deoxy-L-arabinose transferase-like glycosyltransferase
MATLTLPRAITRTRSATLLLVVLVVGGLALRLYAIGAKSLWIDEAFSIWMAAQPLAEIWRYTVLLDQHPPLYYTLLHFWAAFGDGEGIMRGFSALWGVLALPVIYLIGQRIGGRALGLLATLILALSPLHISFAQNTRMYTMLTFNAAMALLCLLHLLDRQETGDRRQETGDRRQEASSRSSILDLRSSILYPRRWWLGFVLFTTLTMLSHNTALFFPVALGLFVVVALGLPALVRRLRGQHEPARAVQPLSLAIGLGVALLLWLPWLPSFMIQSRRVYDEFWIQPPTFRGVLTHWRDLGSAFGPGGPYLVPLVLVFGGLALLGAWRLRRRPAVLVLLLVLLLVPFAGELLVSLRRPIFYTRTLIWTSIPLYLLMAAGLLQLRFRPLIAIVALALALLNSGSLVGYYRNYEPEDWRSVAGHVASQMQPGDVLLFNAGWMQIPFDYYYRRVGAPTEEHGVPADMFERGILEPKMTAADTERLAALIDGRPRVWLLYSHNWYTDPQSIIPRYLSGAMGRPQLRDFKGIEVYLYERR